MEHTRRQHSNFHIIMFHHCPNSFRPYRCYYRIGSGDRNNRKE